MCVRCSASCWRRWWIAQTGDDVVVGHRARSAEIVGGQDAEPVERRTGGSRRAAPGGPPASTPGRRRSGRRASSRSGHGSKATELWRFVEPQDVAGHPVRLDEPDVVQQRSRSRSSGPSGIDAVDLESASDGCSSVAQRSSRRRRSSSAAPAMRDRTSGARARAPDDRGTARRSSARAHRAGSVSRLAHGSRADLVLHSAAARSLPCRSRSPAGRCRAELTRDAPRSGRCRQPAGPRRRHGHRGGTNRTGGRSPCRPFRCGSCSRPESTSAIRPAAGTPRCARSSSPSATGSTSSTWPRPSSAWTSPWPPSPRPSPVASRSSSSAPRSRPRSRSSPRRRGPTCPTSRSAGSAACSPTSRRSRSASVCSSSSRPASRPATSSA